MIETPNRTELSALAEDDAVMHHASAEDMMQAEAAASIVASGMHYAETVHADLAPYSLTREQVSQKYKEAGFVVKPRTVSLYAKEGRLRAVKVEAKNGLERYVFDAASVDEDIARRRSYDQPDALYVGMADGAD